MAKVTKDNGKLSESDILDESDNGWKAQDLSEDDDGLDFTMDDDPASDVNIDSGIGEDEVKDKQKADKKKEDDDDIDIADEDEVVEEEDDYEDDDEDEPDEDESEEDEEENKESYSKKVRKRIEREQKLKREAEERAETAEQAVYEANVRTYEAQKVGVEALRKENAREIEHQKALLKLAKEEDESDKEMEAQVELTKLFAEASRLEEGEKSLKEPAKRAPRAAQASPATTKWVARNRWFVDPTFQSEADYARSIDKQLGNDPVWKDRVGESDYFAELDRRIHSKIPSLRVQIKKTYSTGKKVNKVSGVSRTGGNGARPDSNRITLTQADIRSAADFGITTKEGLRAYAKEKWKREQRELKLKGVRS